MNPPPVSLRTTSSSEGAMPPDPTLMEVSTPIPQLAPDPSDSSTSSQHSSSEGATPPAEPLGLPLVPEGAPGLY